MTPSLASTGSGSTRLRPCSGSRWAGSAPSRWGAAGRACSCAPDAEEVALAGAVRSPSCLVEVDEHLHLDAARVAGADGGHRIAPDEEAGVADASVLVRRRASSRIRG